MRSDWAAADASKSDLKATQSNLKLFTQSKPQRALCSLPRKKIQREKKYGKKNNFPAQEEKKEVRTSKCKCQLWTGPNSVSPQPQLTSTPCPTPGQTSSDYVGQFWCPDCDWSAFNAILLNGSVKMVRFERWHAQISAQRLYAWTTKVGGELCMVPYWLGMLERLLCDTHAPHIYEVVSWTPSPTRNTRPAAYAELFQKLSQTPFRLTITHTQTWKTTLHTSSHALRYTRVNSGRIVRLFV